MAPAAHWPAFSVTLRSSTVTLYKLLSDSSRPVNLAEVLSLEGNLTWPVCIRAKSFLLWNENYFENSWNIDFAILIFCFPKSAILMTWHQPNPVFKTTIVITRVNKAFKLLLFPKTIISKILCPIDYQRCLDDVGITAPNPFLIIEINFLKTKICGRHNWIFSRPMMTPNNLGWL